MGSQGGIIAAVLLAICASGCSDIPPREELPRADIDPSWPTVPGDAAFGQVSAVEVDSHGHVFVLHRAGREWIEPFPEQEIGDPTVFMFDQSGELLARWGADAFIMPHGLSIDAQDRVWITDVGREQVFRFSHDGEQELVLGERGVTAQDAGHFGRPADVAFLGERVLVADGYINTRVAEFDGEGDFIRDWGDFRVAHAIAADTDRLYVADRESGRIALFTHGGAPLGEWRSEAGHHTYGLAALGEGRVLAVEGRDGSDRMGAILRIYGRDGAIEGSFDAGLPGEGASLGHDIAVDTAGSAYMTDVYGNRVIRIVLPTSAQ